MVDGGRSRNAHLVCELLSVTGQWLRARKCKALYRDALRALDGCFGSKISSARHRFSNTHGCGVANRQLAKNMTLRLLRSSMTVSNEIRLVGFYASWLVTMCSIRLSGTSHNSATIT